MYHNDLIFDYIIIYIILYLLSYEETATNLGCWELGMYCYIIKLFSYLHICRFYLLKCQGSLSNDELLVR